ncbi:MAG TPA: hypothetical protein VE177_01355, partial [Candidatus Binatus sp.]|nr:hypothetical protein [Candidatus Binatus sp.]
MKHTQPGRRNTRITPTPRPVEQLKIAPGISISQLLEEMRHTGVLGAGRMGNASQILREMFSDPAYTNILTIAGPIVP